MRSFLILWCGQATSLLGSQVVQFALIWWLTKETGSATVLAVASFLGLFPHVVLGPLIGTLVDRWNRKLILLVADSGVALASLTLAFLFYRGGVEVWQVYAVLFARAVGSSFHGPTMMASTTLMVPRRHLMRIQGLNQLLGGGLNLISAPLGALLLEVLPMGGVVAVDVVTALFAIGPLLLIHVPQPSALPRAGKASIWNDLSAGLAYIRGMPGLLMLISMAALVNLLLVPAFSLLPLLVTDHFGGQALQLAGMEATKAAGILAGGLLLSVWGGFSRRILTTLSGMMGLGLSIMLIGLMPPELYAYAAKVMFLVGLMVPITNGPIQAVVQSSTEPAMQGRVFTVMTSIAMAMSPLGLMIAGPVADLVGVRAWYVAGGIACMTAGLVAFSIPVITRMGEEGAPAMVETLPVPANDQDLESTVAAGIPSDVSASSSSISASSSATNLS